MSDTIEVEVVWATPTDQTLRRLTLPAKSAVRQAIEAAGLSEHFPPTADSGGVGVHGRLCDYDEPLREGDRVEIYRPLTADPKDVRRQRVQQMRSDKKRAG